MKSRGSVLPLSLGGGALVFTVAAFALLFAIVGLDASKHGQPVIGLAVVAALAHLCVAIALIYLLIHCRLGLRDSCVSSTEDAPGAMATLAPKLVVSRRHSNTALLLIGTVPTLLAIILTIALGAELGHHEVLVPAFTEIVLPLWILSIVFQTAFLVVFLRRHASPASTGHVSLHSRRPTGLSFAPSTHTNNGANSDSATADANKQGSAPVAHMAIIELKEDARPETATTTLRGSSSFHEKSPPASSRTLTASDGHSSKRSSFSTIHRPGSLKKVTLTRQSSHHRPSTRSSTDLPSRPPSQQDDAGGFDTWDTSDVSPQLREAVMQQVNVNGTAPGPGGLPPIPGSRSPSPATALEGPFHRSVQKQQHDHAAGQRDSTGALSQTQSEQSSPPETPLPSLRLSLPPPLSTPNPPFASSFSGNVLAAASAAAATATPQSVTSASTSTVTPATPASVAAAGSSSPATASTATMSSPPAPQHWMASGSPVTPVPAVTKVRARSPSPSRSRSPSLRQYPATLSRQASISSHHNNTPALLRSRTPSMTSFTAVEKAEAQQRQEQRHIHPLFRSNSPTPPPGASVRTVVTAAPEAGEMINRAAFLRMRRSESVPTVRSPLARSESTPDIRQHRGDSSTAHEHDTEDDTHMAAAMNKARSPSTPLASFMTVGDDLSSSGSLDDEAAMLVGPKNPSRYTAAQGYTPREYDLKHESSGTAPNNKRNSIDKAILAVKRLSPIIPIPPRSVHRRKRSASVEGIMTPPAKAPGRKASS